MDTIEFFVPGKPVPKARPRLGRWGTYTPKTTEDYQNLIREHYIEKYGDEIVFGKENELEICITIYAPGKGPGFSIRGDWDNYGKAICDALNGLCYVDDIQITKAEVKKMRANKKPVGVCVIIKNRGGG